MPVRFGLLKEYVPLLLTAVTRAMVVVLLTCASSYPASVTGRSRRRANGAQEIVHPIFMPLVR